MCFQKYHFWSFNLVPHNWKETQFLTSFLRKFHRRFIFGLFGITITINFHFELNEWDQNYLLLSTHSFRVNSGVNPSNQTFLHPSKNVSNPLKSKIEKNLLHLLLVHGRGGLWFYPLGQIYIGTFHQMP